MSIKEREQKQGRSELSKLPESSDHEQRQLHSLVRIYFRPGLWPGRIHRPAACLGNPPADPGTFLVGHTDHNVKVVARFVGGHLNQVLLLKVSLVLKADFIAIRTNAAFLSWWSFTLKTLVSYNFCSINSIITLFCYCNANSFPFSLQPNHPATVHFFVYTPSPGTLARAIERWVTFLHRLNVSLCKKKFQLESGSGKSKILTKHFNVRSCPKSRLFSLSSDFIANGSDEPPAAGESSLSHSHSLSNSQTLSLKLSLSLSLSNSLSLKLSNSLPQTLSNSLSNSLPQTLTLTLSNSLSLSNSQTLSLKLSNSLPQTLTLNHSQTLSLSITLSRTLSINY